MQLLAAPEDKPEVTVRYKLLKADMAEVDKTSWGPTVRGVKMRLHAPTSRWAQGRVPVLRVDFVNINNDRIDRLALLNENWAIELDGRLYRVPRPDPTPLIDPLAFGPGTTQKDILVPLHEDLGWTDLRSKLGFLPGKHTVRVRFTHDETVKDNSEAAGIHLVSNPLAIEIVATEDAKDVTAGEEEEDQGAESSGPAEKTGTSGAVESSGRSTGARDQLLGWYSLPDRHHESGEIIPGSGRLIPVLKYGADYYSVAGPGWEVPLKQCPEGLEWGATPSSMDGTKFGLNEESDTVYIRIVDQQRGHIQDTFVSGEKRTLTKVKKPSGLFDATAPPPATLDDFVGWYAHLWVPQPSRIQIRMDGEKYVAAVFVREGTTDKWNENKKHELAPLPEGLGLAFGDNSGPSFNYNADLRRFELCKGSESGFRIPLTRIPAPAPGETVPTLRSFFGRIGIPCWH
jgi:hypothetical protein